MDRFEKGMAVTSKTGHDFGKTYIIYEVDEKYIYLVDGEIRKIANPKKKKKKHVQIIKQIMDIENADDVKIKRWLKLLKMSE